MSQEKSPGVTCLPSCLDVFTALDGALRFRNETYSVVVLV